jgi:hypothetical protein
MSWAESILTALQERDLREGAHSKMIEDCAPVSVFKQEHADFARQDKRLAQNTKMLKDRNAALLKASISVKNGTSTTE